MPESTRVSPDEVEALRRYVQDPGQDDLLALLANGLSTSEAANELGRQRKSVNRSLNRLRKRAERFNYQHGNDAMPGHTDMPLAGKSTLIKYEDPRSDGAVLEWVKTKAEHQRLHDGIAAMIASASVKSVKPRKAIKTDDDAHCGVPVIADHHFGMLAYGLETGGADWNLDVAQDCLRTAIEDHVARLPKLEHGILINTGDLHHFNETKSKTSGSGNILDSDASWIQMNRAASEALWFAVDAFLSRFQHLTLINVRGNHDETSAWALNEMAKLRYAREPRVTVNSNDRLLNAHRWERNLIVTHHGHGRAMNKQAVHNAVTTQFRAEYGKTNFCLGVLGHLHTGSEMSCGPGTRYEVFNTLAPADAWHASQLYGGDRIMHSLVLHKEGGIIARNQHDPVLHARMRLAA